ncbi:stress-response A/B barrel domain-containing protein UP3 [Olea europaea var. sylvestris]|uniref:stress-response A/B barrel domain-containing protein UP3 n=1 Tax=Olea europaea var. sylvestris TaxID=158386 RepID=UPI000C1D1A61|nr:stress-response A/B barrel domain-containing protein UP3 [Olea europaea var. sylvestris]
MLCVSTRAASARTHFLSSSFTATATASFSAATLKPFYYKPFKSRFHPSIKMLSSSNSDPNPKPSEFVEHVVLFKVRQDADPSAINAMVNNLNGLASLDPVLHLKAGPIARVRSSSLSFTHMLHSRHRSKPDLGSYADHPAHISVVTNYVRPIIDDVMAVDWASDDITGSVIVPHGSAMRFTFLKLKEGVEESGKNEIFGVVKGIKDKFPSIEQLSVGENFSPGRAKGFSIGSVAVFKGMTELEALDSDSEVANEQKDKVREFLDSVLVLDFH